MEILANKLFFGILATLFVLSSLLFLKVSRSPIKSRTLVKRQIDRSHYLYVFIMFAVWMLVPWIGFYIHSGTYLVLLENFITTLAFVLVIFLIVLEVSKASNE